MKLLLKIERILVLRGLKIAVKQLFFIAVFIAPFLLQAQEVKATIDSTSIKIGEQITYKIEVETDSTDLVVFPEGQTFKPLELFDTSKIDTTAIKDRFQLIKEYALTEFDSGAYTIPQQEVVVNDRKFVTDSFQVQVANIAVDTTKQKMFPIKSSVEIKDHFSMPNWVWWVLGIVIVLGLLAFFFLRRKKKLEEAKAHIPPYEKAMQTLHALDESDTLKSGDIKGYYSVLTESVKRYLDEKIDDRALESTTDELILRLEMLKNSNKLYLKEHVIKSLEAILKRADLTKFAGISMDRITAKADRKTIEEDIEEFKKSIPEPTEEELLQDQVYREGLARKRKKRRILYGGIAGILVILIGTGLFFGSNGIHYIKDVVFGSPTSELLRGDWMRSEYGSPGVTITTPEVLVRQPNEKPKSGQPNPTPASVFSAGAVAGEFYVMVSVSTVGKGQEIDLDKATEAVHSELEKRGGKNIIVKHEDFKTPNEVEGVKVFGSYAATNPITKNKIKKKYIVLNFGYNDAFEQVLLLFNDEEAAAEEVASRIINSVELKKAEN